ncbi:MAG: hypothetical protein JJ850_14595 [Kordiimonadaceae bacterium]|nr:hypothetical protein [Kordiimonadaceae bacterium]MBO6570056.1 hypothetical protein [Kordiimonadaceae bacterium]MBO6965847.1 hypothetical protein [Kordiimonadaceae bacterium]
MSEQVLRVEFSEFFYYLEEGEAAIQFVPEFREFSIICSTDGSCITLKYCPWSGKEFPDSLTEQWFGELEKLGIDDPFGDAIIPTEFRSDQWWINRGL